MKTQFMSLTMALGLLMPFQGTATQEAPKADSKEMKAAEEILAKSVDAMGGTATFEKLKTQYQKGTLEIKGMGIKGTMESYAKAPNMSLGVFTFQGMGESVRGFDGKIGWANDPMGGLRELEGPELELIKQESVFNQQIKWKEIYKEYKSTGAVTKVEDKEVYEVELTPKEGKARTMYFDAKTYLPWMMKMTVETPYGTTPAKSYMTDYRDVDGMKIPFSLRQVAGPQEFVATLTEVKNNIEIEDKKFAKPAGEDEKPAEKKDEKKPN